MAWLYQRPDSERWWIAYRLNGVQVLKSTGQSEPGAAKAELAKVEAMLAMQRAGALTVELFHAISGKTLPTTTLKAALNSWLDEVRGSAGPRTVEKYQGLADELTKHFHVTDTGPLVSDISREQLQQVPHPKAGLGIRGNGEHATEIPLGFLSEMQGHGRMSR